MEWEDFKFAASEPTALDDRVPGWQDAELHGLSFLTGIEHQGKREAWKGFWPRRAMHWDAVGWVYPTTGDRKLVLVEAKAEAGSELISDSKATNPTSVNLIESSLNDVKTALGVNPAADWTNGYYQAANRIAVLWFLRREGVDAHLLDIYFCGDRRPDSGVCPQNEGEWQDALAKKKEHLQLPEKHLLSNCMHELFLPVRVARGSES